jgi:uncharacterized protein (DUF1499 family)
MKILSRVALFIVMAVTGIIVAGQLGLLHGSRPVDIGVRDGMLKPPSLTNNSVNSQATLYPQHPQNGNAAIEPFPIKSDGAQDFARLADLVKSMPRTAIVRLDKNYLHAECTTPLLRFTDDLEFWLDDAHKVIQVRSASRLGEEDLGTNRRRVETIRAQFLKN